MPEKIKNGLDVDAEENGTGIERLSSKWQTKVRDKLAVERATSKRRDGTFPKEYYEMERKLVEAAKEQQDKEGVLYKKIRAKLGSFVSGAASLGSAAMGMASGSVGYIAGKVGDGSASLYGGMGNIAWRHKKKSTVLLAMTLALGVDGAKMGYDRLTLKEPAQLSPWSKDDGSPFDGLAYTDEYKRLKEIDQNMQSKQGETPTTEPVIYGMDNLGFTDKLMGHIVRETFPKNCFSNVKEINFDQKIYNMPKEFGMKGVQLAYTIPGSGTIFLTGGCADQFNSTIINDILTREIGRMNDWISNRNLSLNDRIVFLDMVASRLASPNRYKSDNVDKINNPDQVVEIELKTEAYFAEIFSAYLSSDYVKLPDSDKKVVKWLITKMDPAFDREAALEKRNELVGLADEDLKAKLKSQFDRFKKS